jgi:hypothetical protein
MRIFGNKKGPFLQFLMQTCVLLFYTEDGGSSFCRNVTAIIQDNELSLPGLQ